MKVKPISETEANAAGLWKRGLYDFEVVAADEQNSKAGNEMIKMQVRVYNTEGKYRVIFDYLVSSEGMAYKIRHFAAAAGMLEAYVAGELTARDCVGKTGRCQLGMEIKDGYPSKNIIADYVPVKTGQPGPLIASKAPEDIDDDIPF